MSDTHCPGFESNKSLTEVKLKCPECGHKWDIFSDELKENIVCRGCGKKLETSKCRIG
jgi:ribosomal protein S27E